MKLQQLRYLIEIARRDLSVSAAAAHLFTSQPGVSQQIRLLEQELGVELFQRRGKQFVALTPAGRAVLTQAQEMLGLGENIRRLTRDFAVPEHGELGIATTHTQAGFVLPPVLREFHQRYPQVRLNLFQGTPLQLADMASQDDVDLVITTDDVALYSRLVLLPVGGWKYAVFCPTAHPLAQITPLTLATIAEYPLITYSFAFNGRSALEDCFRAEGLRPRLAVTAVDTSVLKRYVREGLGVGLMAAAAFDPAHDHGLTARDTGALLPQGQVHVAFAPGRFLRAYVYDFITLLAPHLTRSVVEEARVLREPQAIAALLASTAPAAMI